MWERLGQPVDVLVVGGGINGAGIARDASRRGLSVALVEMNDLAYGTSSRSSKLVHGGLRYLEQREVGLVFESVSERRILMDIAPHLVNPLGFLFPVYTGTKRKLWLINAGMWLYDGLALFRTPRNHRVLKPAELAAEEPALRQDDLEGAPLYYDCSTDDTRLTLETALDAIKAGAVIATRVRAESFVRDRDGRLAGAVVRNTFTGEAKTVSSRVVINATGPWTDDTLGLPRGEGGSTEPHKPLLRTTKGVHIVVTRERLPLNHAVVCNHPTDARVLFAIPWGDRSYIGTTDTDVEGRPEDVAASADDVDYLLAAANAHFPDNQLRREDVIATWAGLRPLIRSDEEGKAGESQVSREHHLFVGPDGLVTIAGGKLTTYRRMSAEVVETAVRILQLSGRLDAPVDVAQTDRLPLPGAVGWPADDDHAAVAEQVLKASGNSIVRETAALLADTYGMRGIDVATMCARDRTLAQPLVSGRPEILAQVDWAVREELAATLCDVMIRRTQLFLRDIDQGLGAASRVAEHMATRLGWGRQQIDAQLEEYREEVERSRRWRRPQERPQSYRD